MIKHMAGRLLCAKSPFSVAMEKGFGDEAIFSVVQKKNETNRKEHKGHAEYMIPRGLCVAYLSDP